MYLGVAGVMVGDDLVVPGCAGGDGCWRELSRRCLAWRLQLRRPSQVQSGGGGAYSLGKRDVVGDAEGGVGWAM
jgi:hypothetical protein